MFPRSRRNSASASSRPGTSSTWSVDRCGTWCWAAPPTTWTSPPSAHPTQTTQLLRGWADRQYLVGVRWGTVGALKDGQRLEITTFRQEVYAEEHRKPSVTFGKDLQTDLSRRDFTINAMAIALPEGGFVDPYGGIRHLAARVLDTPLDPEISFSDDPLRMVRAARFVGQLDVVPAPRVIEAMRSMRERLADRLARTHP